MDDTRHKRMRFRAWHRGMKEADQIVGSFFDRYAREWDEAETVWFEAFLDEEDVEILAWALGTEAPPARLHGAMMDRFCKLDYVKIVP